MAYQTGTVASPTALKSIIETFCTDNGWTLSGSDYLYKGLSFVKLAVPAGPSPDTLQLLAANSSDGLTTPYGYTPKIFITAGDWPITYYAFVHTNPDLLVCVLQYATNKIQTTIFGDIVKVHSSAFTGGNFVYASMLRASPTYNILRNISETILNGDDGSGAVIPFARGDGTAGDSRRSSTIHAEIDSLIWLNSQSNQSQFQQNTVFLGDYTLSQYFRSPNTWNNQAHLVPIHLHFGAASSLSMYLGYIEHLRFIRIDNYEIGDIVTLGSDKWKVFPWYSKDTTNKNGASGVAGSGTLGFAVRYDGP